MKTLIVRYDDRVRFLITNHPEYRFQKLQQQMPVTLDLVGVTTAKSKDIKLRFANQKLGDSEWYRLTDEFADHLLTLL